MDEVKTVGDLRRELDGLPDDLELSVMDDSCELYVIDNITREKAGPLCMVWLLHAVERE